MQVTKREAAKVFKKLDIDVTQNNHHVRGWLKIEGKKISPVHYSHGNGPMPGKIGDKFRKSFYLTPPEFSDLINCPLSKEEFYELLLDRTEE